MKNLFENKFLIVTLVIAILLVGTTSFISALGYTSYVRNAIGIVLTPIQKGANSVFDSIESHFVSKDEYKKIKEENDKLKQQIAEQQENLANAENALEENEKLKEYLGIKDEHNDFVMTDAEVISNTSSSNSMVITINKGLSHGMKPGLPVIDKFGLIGCIDEVGHNWSKVRTIISPDTSVGVYVERTGENGISSGTFSASKEEMFTVSYLGNNTDVAVGDRIISSGDGSMFPKGLLLGTVTKIEKDSNSRETIAFVTPISQIKEVKSVMVITEFTMLYE